MGLLITLKIYKISSYVNQIVFYYQKQVSCTIIIIIGQLTLLQQNVITYRLSSQYFPLQSVLRRIVNEHLHTCLISADILHNP